MFKIILEEEKIMTQVRKVSFINKILFLAVTIVLVIGCSKIEVNEEKKYFIAAKAIIKAFENKDYFNSFIAYSDLNIDSLNYFDQVRFVNLFSETMKSLERRGIYTKINLGNKVIHRFDLLGYSEKKKTYLKEELEFEEKENLLLLNYIFIKFITKEEGKKYSGDYAQFEFSKTDEEGIQNYFKQLNLSIKARKLRISNISKEIKGKQKINVIPITSKSYLQILKKGDMLTVTGFKGNKLTKKIKIENCKAIDKIVLNSSLVDFFEF